MTDPGQAKGREHSERRENSHANLQSLRKSHREVKYRKKVSALDLDSYIALLKLQHESAVVPPSPSPPAFGCPLGIRRASIIGS